MSAFDRLEAALAAHGCDPKRRGDHLDAKCPSHDDRVASLTADRRRGRVLVKCHAGNGCVIESVVAALGCTMADLFDEPIEKGSKPEITAPYDYTDEHGTLLYQVVRYHPKGFRQRRPDGHGGWEWSLNGTRRVPFRLPRLIEAIGAGKWVFICEGEKDVETLEKLTTLDPSGLTATTNAGGAGKFLPEFAKYFEGARVAILPDWDKPGRAHAEQVASILHRVAADVRIIELPGLTGHKGSKDVTDWITTLGHDEIEIKALIDATPNWTLPTTEEVVPLQVIDGSNAVETPPVCASEITEERTSVLLTFELLDIVRSILERYIVFQSEHQVVALTLWVLHTYVFEAFDSTPYLAISSPTKQSGKSLLFDVLGLLVARPWTAVGATEAVLFRKIAAATPTLLLDEIDTTFGKDATLTEGIRGILNAGYRRGGVVARCVGRDYEIHDFEVYCPKAFAGIGDGLPDTIVDRSIPIKLRRKRPTERASRFRQAVARQEHGSVAKYLAAWAVEIGSSLSSATPELPDELSDRQQDTWEPLLAIADLAGGDWPETARRAALALHGSVVDQDSNVRLLAHCRETFDERATDAITSEDLLSALVNRGDDSPWAHWWVEDVENGKIRGPASRLAFKLKDFGPRPHQIWLSGKKVRGYERADFEDAWSRYLPSEPLTIEYSPEQNGRTVDRRLEGISGLEPNRSISAFEQDSTVLPSFLGEKGEREGSEPFARIDDQDWLALCEEIGQLPADSSKLARLEHFGVLELTSLTDDQFVAVRAILDSGG